MTVSNRPLLSVGFAALLAAVHPAALPALAQTAPPVEANADPTDGSTNVDQVVAFGQDRVLSAVKQAMATYGCDVRKERPDVVECTRSRHVGVFVGSGGEKVTAQLSASGPGTRVVIKTGKGFVGRVGKKNWSTPIFREMERLLETR